MAKYTVCNGVYETLLKPENMIFNGSNKGGLKWNLPCDVCGKIVALNAKGHLTNHKAA